MGLMDEKFLDSGDGTYFYVDRDQATPLVRSKSIYDQVLPSGNSMAARVSHRLYRLTGDVRHQERAQAIIRQLNPHARENPWGFAHLWTVQTLALTPPLDLTLVGDPQDARTQALLQAAYRSYRPERRLVLKNPKDGAALEELLPWTRDYNQPGSEPAASPTVVRMPSSIVGQSARNCWAAGTSHATNADAQEPCAEEGALRVRHPSPPHESEQDGQGGPQK